MPDTVIASIRDPINDSGLFDSAFYMAKYGRIIDGSDPLDHYLRYGTRHRLDPNLYFDAEFYAQQYGQDIGEANLLWHYITIGERAGCQPSSYFSTDWYAAHLSPAEAQGGILAHYLTVGWKLRVSPHPLFDIPHYRRQLPRTGAPRRDYFADYLREGFRAGLSPHPLFHPGHYWQQVGEGMTIAPLVHYLTWGWIEDLSPHPLFDPVHYRLTARTLGEECPLVHYLVSEEPGDEPHYLFSDSFYLAQTPLVRTKRGRLYDANRVPLVHYVRRQDPVKAATHPLFDPDFYAADCRRLDIEDFTDRVPLIDYVQQGWRLGARPHRIFDVEFYLGQVGAIDMDPVRHYLTCEGFRAASPNPGLDQDFYTRESMDFDLSAPPIVHFLKTPTEQRGRPHAFFDPIYYKQKYKDITDANLCPSLHFLTFGLYEGRFPNRWFSPEYVYERWPRDSFVERSAINTYLASGLPRAKRILFVSHDATLTGAPGIILRLLEDFTKLENVECFVILDRGGERLPDFSRAGHTHVMSKSIWELGEGHAVTKREIAALLELVRDNRPLVALVNSAESRHIASVLHQEGIPVITLVHEFADFYEAGCFERIYAASREIVFPAQFVLSRADALVPIPDGLGIVRGQGLLRDNFGEMSRNSARRRVLNELKLPDDTFIVMSCGTVDQRKGVDYFVAVGLRFCGTRTDSGPICFIWVGGGARHNTSSYAYAILEIKSAAREREIRFVDERPDVEQFYVAADVFLLTARADPFPCVVHEAMASGLPVIAFADAGGAPELIGSEAGCCVPLGDTRAMCDRLMELYSDEVLRRKLGEAARRIIKEEWKASGYFNFMAGLVSAVSGVVREDFGKPRVDDEPASKRVFFLNADWSLSGVNTFTENLVEELNRRGFQAEILFTRGRFSHLSSSDDKLVLPRVPTRFMQPEAAAGHAEGPLITAPSEVWKALERFLAREQPCVVIPNVDYVASALTPVLPERVGVVGIVHSDHAEHYEHVYRLGRFWNRIIAVSKKIADEIRDENSSFASRLTIIPYGVPCVGLAAGEIERNKAKAGEPLSLLYAGRFETEQKNILDYVKLAQQLQADGRQFKLFMCGEGTHHSAVEASLRGLSKAGVAEIKGRLSGEQLAPKLDSADVFLLLSDYEGLSLGMLEAMARGCIPIVTNMESGVPEVISEGVNGFIVELGDLRSVSEKIAWLIANPESRLAMAVAAHNTLSEKKLRKEDMGEAYAALLEEVFQEMHSDGGFDRPGPGSGADKLNGILPPPTMHTLRSPSEIWGNQLLLGSDEWYRRRAWPRPGER